MLLQSADKARDFVEYDSQTGKLKRFSVEVVEVAKLQAEIAGRYGMVEQVPILFFRDSGLLKLKIREHLYEIDDKVESSLNRGFRTRLIRQVPHPSIQDSLSHLLLEHSTFELIREGKAILTFKYRTPLPEAHLFDPTPFVEEEDFDFMLFIHNVLSDSTRRNMIWRKDS